MNNTITGTSNDTKQTGLIAFYLRWPVQVAGAGRSARNILHCVLLRHQLRLLTQHYHHSHSQRGHAWIYLTFLLNVLKCGTVQLPLGIKTFPVPVLLFLHTVDKRSKSNIEF
jgi:hypothetical protein